MSHFGYLLAGYMLTFVVLAGYAAWVLARRRSLARLVPEAGGPERGRAARR